MDTPQTPSSHTAAGSQDGSSSAEEEPAVPQESEEIKILREEKAKLEESLAKCQSQEGECQKDEEKQMESFVGLFNQYKREYAELDDKYRKLNEYYTMMRACNSELERSNKRYKSDISQLEATIQGHEMRHDKLRRVFDDNSRKFDEVQRLWQSTVEELEETKKSEQQYVVDDDIMVQKWKTLCYTIRNTANQGFNKPLRQDFPPSELPKVLGEIHPAYNQKYFWREDDVSLIFGAAIWRILDALLFQCPLAVYDRTADRVHIRLESAPQLTTDTGAGISGSKVHEWRACTGHIFHTLIGACEEYKKFVTKELSKLLGAHSMVDDGLLHRQFEGIVTKAAELACIFARSRAYYHVRAGYTGQPDDTMADGITIDTEWMEESGGDGSGKVVDMMLSPALIKHGNAEGQDYDQSLVLVKADIISRG